MAVNNKEEYQSGNSSVFDDYSVSEGSSTSYQDQKDIQKKNEGFNTSPGFNEYSWSKPYKIPIKVVKAKVDNALSDIRTLLSDFEGNLNKVYINPFLDKDIEEAHFHIWDEIYKNNPTLVHEHFPDDENTFHTKDLSTGDPSTSNPMKTPQFISFRQYKYAEEHGCRACRSFVKEYDRLISHSIFVHLFDFRYFLKLLSEEALYIKKSLLTDFGEEYQDESEEQTATFYHSWAEMSSHYTKRIAQQLNEQAAQIPSSEVDKITKKQAAQFQAFFSIRVSAFSEAIDNVLFSLKKELSDHSQIFYEKYISNAITFKTKVSSPLELAIQTTNLSTDAPLLSGEIITAVNTFKGNFGSILTDMTQRRNNLSQKFDKLFSLNSQRRKYINYIDQLSVKATLRPKVIVAVTEDDYSSLFDRIVVDNSERESLNSDHKMLHGLQENHHPQYLLRSGGKIFGDISVVDGSTIDGVDLSEHAHTGVDGSRRIMSTDIDYETPKGQINIMDLKNGSIGTMEVSVSEFVPDIRTGGIPVVDVVIDISVPDEVRDKYEFELLYREN